MSSWNEIIKKYLIDTDDISEIGVNSPTSVYARRKGRRVKLDENFGSPEYYWGETFALVKMINPNFDENVDKMEFLQEGRLLLPNGNTARVHIVLSPVSYYPLVTIAKKSESLATLDDIYNSGSMSTKMKNFIEAAVDCRFNIVFSGSTGSGKTTFVEAVSKMIPMDTRIGVVEDSPELRLIQDNVVYLHTSPWKPGMDPNKEVTLDWCTRQINRMRTDLLIIGETRGKEFKEFLMGANSGMEGSMTTLHANDPRAALGKMSQFVNEAQPMPMRVINKLISGTLDLIIQLGKTVDGRYRTLEITEVSNTLSNDEDASIATTSLSKYDELSDTWNDKFLISDNLRQRLIDKGYDCSTFLKKETTKSTGIPLFNI